MANIETFIKLSEKLKVIFMPTQAQPEVRLDAFEVPPAPAVYPPHVAYFRPAYTIELSPTLIHTPDMNFYKALEALARKMKDDELPDDTRFLMQNEGHAKAQAYRNQGEDPRKAPEFGDYFAKNRNKLYLWEWTLNALRADKGWENGRIDSGTGKYPRLVLEPDWAVLKQAMRDCLEPGFNWRDIGDRLNRVAGVHQVPVGNVILSYEPVWGLPLETQDIPWPHEGYDEHFGFDPNPRLDEISGHHDVAVQRRGSWHRDGGEWCLDVGAGWVRSYAGSFGGFRPVRGSVPEVQPVSSNFDVEQVRREAEQKVRREIADRLRNAKLTDVQAILKEYEL